MPIYEYGCDDCENDFTVLRLRASDEPSVCPKCDSAKIKKKLSSFSCSMPTSGGVSGGVPGGGFGGGGG
jgi:putative FmdB family regulatory protein